MNYIRDAILIVAIASGAFIVTVIYAIAYLPQQAISSEVSRAMAVIDDIESTQKQKTMTYFINVGLLRLIGNIKLYMTISIGALILSISILSLL